MFPGIHTIFRHLGGDIFRHVGGEHLARLIRALYLRTKANWCVVVLVITSIRNFRTFQRNAAPTMAPPMREPPWRGRQRLLWPCAQGEAPKKCSTFLGGFSHKIIITSTTPIVTPEFSSDLERAPGARSIADENSGVTFGVVELRRCEAYEHFRSHPVLLGTLPRGWLDGRRQRPARASDRHGHV